MSSNCVMIGDIRESRTLDDWASVFSQLDGALKAVNREFSDDILLNFKPTVGDEFQGALREARKAYAVCVSIKSQLPVRVYCGIGIGDIEKPLHEDVGMRGSGFYRARRALESCKEEKRSVIIRSADTPDLMDDAINTLLHFIETLENSWTGRQREVLSYYRSHPDHTYEQLGEHFGIAKQTVWKILKAADWEVVSEGEATVNRLLEHMSLEPQGN